MKDFIAASNRIKFDAVRALGLPVGHYAITSSGPLGARGLRVIGDADLIVDDELWKKLADQYGTKNDQGFAKIDLPGDLVEILGEGSFFCPDGQTPNGPTVILQIREAEIIDGLPFVKLEYILYFKQVMGRDKDKRDIKLIQDYLEKI